MRAIRLLVLVTAALTACSSDARTSVPAELPKQPVVRLAELEIDRRNSPTTSPHCARRSRHDPSEPGVLTLYAVQVKGDPARVRLFEMYADSNAYDAHITSPHSGSTRREQPRWWIATLIETVPVLLGSKSSDRLRSFVRSTSVGSGPDARKCAASSRRYPRFKRVPPLLQKPMRTSMNVRLPFRGAVLEPNFSSVWALGGTENLKSSPNRPSRPPERRSHPAGYHRQGILPTAEELAVNGGEVPARLPALHAPHREIASIGFGSR